MPLHCIEEEEEEVRFVTERQKCAGSAGFEVVMHSSDLLWDALGLHRRRTQVWYGAQEETSVRLLRLWCTPVISCETAHKEEELRFVTEHGKR